MIRPAARIAASLADRNHVHDLVETAVAGKREPVPDYLAAGSFNWRHACIGSEVSLAREARNVADYSHNLRCQDWADAENLGEHGAGGLHLTSDTLVELALLSADQERARLAPPRRPTICGLVRLGAVV